MNSLLWFVLLMRAVVTQNAQDATALLGEVKTFGEDTKTWRAEAVQTSQLTGSGMNLKSDIRIKVAAQPSLKMIRQNSGGDRTTMVCDGAKFFYSGDGHSYYMYQVTQQCDFPLIKFYEPSLMDLYKADASPASISVVGEDTVHLADGERRCALVRAVSDRGSFHTVRTMCIDPSRPIILRDVVETEDNATGNKMYMETRFTSFENNPTFSPDTFRITVPFGYVEAKPPQ